MDEGSQDLALAAQAARRRAHAPYSRYPVGAAVCDAEGRIWSGCNVENASYGLTVCAERVAAFKMVSEGGREIAEVAVATEDGGSPCGACLQVLLEFAPDPSKVLIRCLGADSETTYTLSELLPHGFRLR